LLIHGRKQWLGNICYNDNHVATSKTFIPEGINYQSGATVLPDNIFKNDMNGTNDPKGTDCWLTVTYALSGDATNGITQMINSWD
jgi:hypothetical protein